MSSTFQYYKQIMNRAPSGWKTGAVGKKPGIKERAGHPTHVAKAGRADRAGPQASGFMLSWAWRYVELEK